MKQHRHPTMAGAFQHAWDLVKALSTEDLRMAARTGGIQMTPERRQAYADAGLPLSTGGGFRTMPESTARNLIDLQRDREHSLSQADMDAVHDLKHKDTLDALHTYGGYYSPRYGEFTANPGDERLEDIHYALTQGQSMEDPLLEQEPERIGRFLSEERPAVVAREFDDPSDVPLAERDYYGRRLHQELAPGATGGVVPMYRTGYKSKGGMPITKPRLFPGELPSLTQQIRDDTPDRFTERLDKIRAERRRAEKEQYPTSDFARRGDAGASPTDQAFRVIQQRKENAERMKQVLADRQREMRERQQDRMMQIQRDRMKSKQPPKGRAGGRRPGEGKNAYKNRMRRQGGRR